MDEKITELGYREYSAKLRNLIEKWEELESNLEEVLALTSTLPLDSSASRKMLEYKEKDIAQSQMALLQEIVKQDCESMIDAHHKLKLWKRCKAPGQSDISSLSVADQVAHSAISFIEYKMAG